MRRYELIANISGGAMERSLVSWDRDGGLIKEGREPSSFGPLASSSVVADVKLVSTRMKGIDQ